MQKTYERWEVCVSSKHNINSYVGYCQAQFVDERRKYVVVKARGAAIENAMKVVQLVKENMGGIHSCLKFQLQFTEDRCPAILNSSPTKNPTRGSRPEMLIETYEEYESCKMESSTGRIMPAIEIVLTTDDVSLESHPGFMRGNPQIKTILVGPQCMKIKKN